MCFGADPFGERYRKQQAEPDPISTSTYTKPAGSNFMGTPLVPWDATANAGKVRPLESYETYEAYANDYPTRYASQRALLESQPGMGIPEDIQGKMLERVGEGISSEASKYGVLRSGETVGSLENASTQIALQDYMTKEQNVNKALGTTTGLEITSLQRAYDEAVANKDYARAEALQQQIIAQQQNANTTSGMFSLGSSGLEALASWFMFMA
jgi:hypothetical protein